MKGSIYYCPYLNVLTILWRSEIGDHWEWGAFHYWEDLDLKFIDTIWEYIGEL